MRIGADVIVIGGGIAGMSAAARIARHADTIVLERESALGYHSSGRSATFYHFGIGDDAVRGMTAASSDFFNAPPTEFGDVTLWTNKPALFIAEAETVPALETLRADMARFTNNVYRASERDMLDLVPVLRTGPDTIVAGLIDTGGKKLDTDALLQANARALRHAGGTLIFDANVEAITPTADGWDVDAGGARYSAKTIVNAAGAWADEIAMIAGVRPLGLRPLRRTIIGFAPPAELDVASWPFTKTVKDDGFYMLPDAGRLLASPMDVTPSAPCDAQPEEYDVALAAWRIEQSTTLTVGRIDIRWAGLRTFAPDNVPTAGFAPDGPNFFWLAGQGGYGLQTSPAMALAVEAFLFDLAWPEELRSHGVLPEHISPDRFAA